MYNKNINLTAVILDKIRCVTDAASAKQCKNKNLNKNKIKFSLCIAIVCHVT